MLLERNLARYPFWPMTRTSKRMVMRGEHLSGIGYHFEVTFDPDNPPGEQSRAVHAFLCTPPQKKPRIYQPHYPDKNPVAFHWSHLIRFLGYKQQSGSTQRRLRRVIESLTAIRITSDQAITRRNTREDSTTEISGELQLFDRFVPGGVPDHEGTVCEVNRVWFSAWYHENLRNRHCVEIDTGTWKTLHATDPLASRLFELLSEKARGKVIRVKPTTLGAVLDLPTRRGEDQLRRRLEAAADRLVEARVLSRWDSKADCYEFVPGALLPPKTYQPVPEPTPATPEDPGIEVAPGVFDKIVSMNVTFIYRKPDADGQGTSPDGAGASLPYKTAEDIKLWVAARLPTGFSVETTQEPKHNVLVTIRWGDQSVLSALWSPNVNPAAEGMWELLDSKGRGWALMGDEHFESTLRRLERDGEGRIKVDVWP